MKPLLANRLTLTYVATTGAALVVVILLDALIGGFLGAQLAVQGVPQEEAIRIVMERFDKISGDLFHVAMALTLTALALWIGRRYVVRWAREIRWRPATPASTFEITGWVLLFGLGFTMFTGWVVPQNYLKQMSEFYQAQSLWGWLGLTLVVGLVGPLLEEWIFRGFMLQSYRLRRGASFALFAQALVFSLIHGEPVLAVGALLIGWIMGRWVLAGGSLYSTFWAHATNNLLSLAGIAFGIPYLRPDTPANAITGLLGLVLVIFVLVLVANRTPYANPPAEEPGPILSGSLVLTITISIFLLTINIIQLLEIMKII